MRSTRKSDVRATWFIANGNMQFYVGRDNIRDKDLLCYIARKANINIPISVNIFKDCYCKNKSKEISE